FFLALTSSIVTTAIPRIASDFNAMLISSWVASRYSTIQAHSNEPIWGKLSDIFGRKCIFLLVLGIFVIASILCGVAQSMISLIIMRALQGIAGSGVYTVLGDIVPLERRANYLGFLDMCFTIATVMGPFIGGTLTDHVSWRGVFFVSIPIVVTSMVIMGTLLNIPIKKERFKTKAMRIDYAGIFLVMIATTLFMLSMSFAAQGYSWDSMTIIVPLVMSCVLVVPLAFVESKVAIEPLFPPKLFRNRSVIFLTIYNVGWGITFLTFVYYAPTYFQIVRNDSAMFSGIRLIPFEVAACTTAFISTWFISRTERYRISLSVGSAIMAIFSGLFITFDINTSWKEIMGIIAFGGLGVGCISQASMIAIQASLSKDDLALASSLRPYTSNLGGGIGIAVASVSINRSLKSNLSQIIPLEYVQHVIDLPAFIYDGLPEQYVEPTIRAYNDAFQYLWYMMMGSSIIQFICSLCIKQHSLSDNPKEKEITTSPSDP
ncbi:MFS general substrate transporter, partial [Lichtheimia hyalospora FSU 10163]